MRLKRWDTQSLLMQASPGRSHIHHSQKYFFHKKSSLLSVPDPEQPTDLIKLALPSARDIVLAVLEWGKHHLHFYLSKSDTGYRMSSTHTLSVLHSPYISVCTGDFCKKDTQYKEQQSWGNHCCFWPFSLPTHWAGSQGVETQPSWGLKHRGDSSETLGWNYLEKQVEPWHTCFNQSIGWTLER